MTIRQVIALLVLGTLGGCGGATSATIARRPSGSSASAQDFAQSSNGLGLDLFRGLGGTGNLAISPASISTALAMTYGGARGTTAEVMATTMHLGTTPEDTVVAAGDLVRAWNDPDRRAYELAVANRLFGQDGFRFDPDFVARTGDAFGAPLEAVDFVTSSEPVRVHINEWVSDRTHARIPTILPGGSITSDTRLVLVNAVYFHGRWAEPFDPSMTHAARFTTDAGAPVEVPTMHRTGGRYASRSVDGVGEVQLLELPYVIDLERATEGQDDGLSMLFLLPSEASHLGALEAQLTDGAITEWIAGMHPQDDLVVALPRFRLEGAPISLMQPLSALGMAEIFADGADFSGMTLPGEHRLYVSDVFHRVFVEVNEAGTEAAAATAVVMVTESAAFESPPRFDANHPFLFLLRDQRTGAVLFLGRVSDPRG